MTRKIMSAYSMFRHKFDIVRTLYCCKTKILSNLSDANHFFPTNCKYCTDNLIEVWFNEVNAFGMLNLCNIPFDTFIRPINSAVSPMCNKSIVKILYNYHNTTISSSTLSKLSNLCDTKVQVKNDGERLDVSCNVPAGVLLPLICAIDLPVSFGEFIWYFLEIRFM